jgi:hypothetical protein
MMLAFRSMTLLLAAALAASDCFAGTDAAGQGRAASRAIVNVDDLMKDVDRHRGLITVRGVVSAIAREDGLVSLVDVRAFAECRATNCCAQLTLPVQWTGTMPAVGDRVKVSGQVRREEAGKLAFAATTLEVRSLRARGGR